MRGAPSRFASSGTPTRPESGSPRGEPSVGPSNVTHRDLAALAPRLQPPPPPETSPPNESGGRTGGTERESELRARTASLSGIAFGRGGDIDGDGIDDLLVASQTETYGSGVAVVPGPLDGNAYIDDTAVAVLTELALAWEINHIMAGGDLDGDGYSDVAAARGGAYLPEAGIVYLYNGPLSGEIPPVLADASVEGANTDSYLGYAIDIPGDVDGDGGLDLLLTAPKDTAYGWGSGGAYVVPGRVSGAEDIEDIYLWSAHGADGDAHLSVGVGAGDTNGDGLIDLLLGAYGAEGDAHTSGAAYLLLGGGA